MAMQESEGGPEVALWRAVIEQAITDGCSKPDDKSSKLDQVRARTWLTDNSSDFREVCALALLDPGAVRRVALKLADSGWPMRRKNGRSIIDEAA